MARGSKDLLKVLANGTNREILSLLRAEPTYPRRLAELVGITEGEAQKRLRLLEEHGLVKGAWVHVGKNVKRYTLEASALRVEVGPDGLSLTLEGASAPAPVKLAPAQEAVPGAEHVVGRAAELRELERLLSTKAAVAVVGIAGQGKSSLAARYARSQPRPVFWTTLRGIEGGPQLLSRLAVFMGARGLQDVVASYVHLDATHDLNAQVALLTEGLGRADALVVVDDVHLAKDEGLRGVLGALLERAGRFRVLLAGRSLPKGLPRARLGLLTLDGLSREDTAALLSAQGLAPDEREARQVRAKTGGHPLALTLLAETARGRGVGLQELAQLLPEARIEAYLWEEVFSDLGPEERAFLSRISVLRGPVDPALAAEVAQDERARERFYALERRHLCVPVGEGYAVHDVVRQFASRLGKVGPEAHARAARALLAHGGLSDALEAMHHFLEAGQPRDALAIARREFDEAAYRFVDMGLAAAYEALLQRLAPLLVGEDRAVALLEMAHARMLLAPAASALATLDEADRAAPKAPGLRLRRLSLEAEARYRANEPAAAAKLYARVLELAERGGDARAVGDALLGRANALEDQGRFALAVRDYARALEAARGAGDLRRVALLESGLARTFLHMGRRAESLRHLQDGLEAAKAFDDVRAEANLRRAVSELWLFERDFDQAWQAAEAYLAAAQRLGDPWSVCCALCDAAWIAMHRRRFGDAERLAREVLQVHQRTPLPFFADQAEAMLVLSSAALGRWAEFEAAARGLSAGAAGMQWFYGSAYMKDMERALADLLTPADLPMARRMLRHRGLVPWIRAPLDRFVRAPPRPGRRAPRAVTVGRSGTRRRSRA